MTTKRKQIVSPPSEDGHVPRKESLESGRPGVQFDPATEILQRLRLVEQCVELLVSQSNFGKVWVEGYQEAMSLLETIPLASNEFNLAKIHLMNALEYCRRREFGAAAYELRLLRGLIQGL